MLDATDEFVRDNNPNDSVAEPQADKSKPLSFRRKFLSTVFNRSTGDFLIGAGMSAAVSTGTKLGVAALIGMSGAPVIVTAVGAAVIAGAATGAVRHAWTWHKDHRGMDNAPSFFSAESRKKAYKSMLMSSVFAGAGGTLFSTLNHFYGDEIGAFVSKSAGWLGLPSPDVIMDRTREAVAETRLFKAAVSAGQHLTSSMEVMQIPSAGTVVEKAKGFFSNLWWGAKIMAGVEAPLSNTPPVVFDAPPSLSPVAATTVAPTLPSTFAPPAVATAIPDIAQPPMPDLSPVLEQVHVPSAVPAMDSVPATSTQTGPMPRPVQGLTPMARPSPEIGPMPRPVSPVVNAPAPTVTETPSFKLNPDGAAVSFDHAAGTSAFSIDPQAAASSQADILTRGADAALGFSGPIIPNTNSLIDLTMAPGVTHIYMPSEDVLQERLQNAMDGKAIRASTKALMDTAFGPAGNAEQAADKAQAMKDLAFRALNGQGGIPKNSDLGLALMQSAAAADNMQAKVDLAYIAYHGLHGVQANPSQALAQMNVLGEHSKAARDFAAEWTHGSRAIAKTAVGVSAGGSLECAWQVDKTGHLAGGVCRGAGVKHFNVGDTVLVPVLKI